MTISNRQQKTHTETGNPHWIEWLTGIVSTVLVLALLSWIGREALVADSKPPNLTVKILRIEQAGALYRVDIELENSGPSTAAAVRVVGKVTPQSVLSETAEVTFDFAPAESRTKGALYFRTDPRSNPIELTPSGFTEP
ncbi:hypothetical protein [Rhizobium sp. FKY42]|uniref:hypothetical protein n=1 Tax=Rhizobium sp. FKY42 TaxID=2562310 RepID=UPI0010BF8F23|nr:hypothetical protein [Rhizobium sp. FKY42]